MDLNEIMNRAKAAQAQALESLEKMEEKADALADAALKLRAAGAQFLRACGEATPAYTGALAVAAMGRDCLR